MNLPSPLMTSEIGSYARATILQRKPQIISQVLEDNAYPLEIVRAVKEFADEIASRPLQPLVEDAPDVNAWNAELQKYAGKTWLEIPWYFAETFFYRRLLEAVRYFQPGVWYRCDPFASAKQRQIEGDIARLCSEWQDIDDLPPKSAFETLVYSSLWGNRADLSNFDIRREAISGAAAGNEKRHVLIDHAHDLYTLLSAGVPRVDFIADNAGVDVLFDLVLADFLLRQAWTDNVVFHLKNQPFFVSDAMPDDVLAMVNVLLKNPQTAFCELGARLEGHLATGKLALRDDPFWTSWKMYRQMPAHLQAELANAGLVFIKGDVNYRRLLDDAHWQHTARMEEIAAYFPTPFVILRTLKSEIMVGLQPGQAEALRNEDPEWLLNGKRGVIQLVLPSGCS
ncbi:MAG: protein-glutamate O-methyltransferase family protein [Anaerolineae bacterium]|nr:protein-glutamate O-methyltransferase family protein [Anaerolineae bacterium]